MALSSFTRELASHLDPGSAWYLREMALTSSDGPGRVCIGPVVSAFPQEGLEGEAWAPALSSCPQLLSSFTDPAQKLCLL